MDRSEVFNVALERLGMSQSEASAVLGVTRKTVYNWSKGACRIPLDVFLELIAWENKRYLGLKVRMDFISETMERLRGGIPKRRGRPLKASPVKHDGDSGK